MEISDESIEPYDDYMISGAVTGRKRNSQSRSPARDMERSMLWFNDQGHIETPKEKALRMVREAESTKARMFPPTGESPSANSFELIAKVDQNYEIVSNHIEQSVQDRIVNGEYIDFGKLLSKDHVLAEEDNHLELIVKNGKMFWAPVSKMVTINCFNCGNKPLGYILIYIQKHISTGVVN